MSSLKQGSNDESTDPSIELKYHRELKICLCEANRDLRVIKCRSYHLAFQASKVFYYKPNNSVTAVKASHITTKALTNKTPSSKSKCVLIPTTSSTYSLRHFLIPFQPFPSPHTSTISWALYHRSKRLPTDKAPYTSSQADKYIHSNYNTPDTLPSDLDSPMSHLGAGRRRSLHLDHQPP